MNKEIYLAGGCFWGCQKFFSFIKGVLKTETGYANGFDDIIPTYDLVCAGHTNFAEVIKIEFDSNIINLNFILEQFYQIIDPTTLNRQGPDIGTQYRTGIYYIDESDKEIIQNSLLELQNKYKEPIVIESLPLKNYFKAEEYHQNYLDNNPSGYCHIGDDKFDYAKNIKI